MTNIENYVLLAEVSYSDFSKLDSESNSEKIKELIMKKEGKENIVNFLSSDLFKFLP